jgi:cell division protein FtsB
VEKAGRQESDVVKRKSGASGKRKQADPAESAEKRDEVAVLKKRIARLESENRQLRKKVALLTDGMGRSSQSPSDSVREQQHNFFKYSNVRRY